MPGMLTLPVACAALVCGPVDEDAGWSSSFDSEPGFSAAVEVGPSPVRMVEFDGGWHFLKASRRLRVWRPEVEFDMKVDAQGHATQCEVVNRFRKNYVNIKLCEVVMDHYTFEPARNAADQAVEGEYHAVLSYKELREEFD